jgi:ribosome-binding protein aMBF1 (putative translation factor)
LDSLVHRVGVERAVLTDLQTMRILPAEAPPEPAAPQSAIDQLAELEHIAASLESLLHPVEQAWQQWTSSHELLLQDRRRLAQCAAQLASPTEAPTPPTPSADPAASAQQDLLERRIEQLEGDRAKLLIDRSVWEETRDAEKTAIERAQQRIRSARLRSALAHRARSARLREQRQQLAADQRRLTAKIGEMLRLEARLQITKRCLAEERLLQAEASARRDSLEAPARTPFDASERVENLRRNLEADWASYKGRLEQSLDALSSLRSQPATASIARSANRLEESLALLQMEKDELARHANVERDRHQAEVDRLRDQIESLAASLIDPPRAAA